MNRNRPGPLRGCAGRRQNRGAKLCVSLSSSGPLSMCAPWAQRILTLGMLFGAPSERSMERGGEDEREEGGVWGRTVPPTTKGGI